MKRDYCESCKWYDPPKPGRLGLCRRDAAQIGGWPAVSPDDWCSRWVANEEVVKAKLRAIDEANAVMGDQ